MVTGERDRMPQKCLRMNADGDLPTCTQTGDGEWIATYPEAGVGVGGGFVAVFVLVLLAGVGVTVWKVSTARRMARDAGMDEGDATAMTLMTDDGFEATYLSSSLRQPGATQEGRPGGSPASRRTPAERLRDLDTLRDQGLVTEEEYAAARRGILGDL